MKRFIALALLVMVLTMVFAVPASAAGPCDGGTGRGYAEDHISNLAKQGLLGNDGHKPGSHQGYSVCNPSGH